MFPGNTQLLHWSIEDPAAAVGNEEERLKAFQRVRDELRGRLREFAAQANKLKTKLPYRRSWLLWKVQPNIARHLAYLRRAGPVKVRVLRTIASR